MLYLNVTNNKQIVLSNDKVYKKKELLEKFEDFLLCSNFKIKKWISIKSSPYHCILENGEGKDFELIFYLKNISGAGWSEKPDVKRVQVTNIRMCDPDNYIPTQTDKTLLILGYYNFDKNPIMVARDAYRYVKHNTNRSAYINIDTLLMGYNKGFLETVNSSQKLWIFTENRFNDFLEKYIAYNLE